MIVFCFLFLIEMMLSGIVFIRDGDKMTNVCDTTEDVMAAGCVWIWCFLVPRMYRAVRCLVALNNNRLRTGTDKGNPTV